MIFRQNATKLCFFALVAEDTTPDQTRLVFCSKPHQEKVVSPNRVGSVGHFGGRRRFFGPFRLLVRVQPGKQIEDTARTNCSQKPEGVA